MTSSRLGLALPYLITCRCILQVAKRRTSIQAIPARASKCWKLEQCMRCAEVQTSLELVVRLSQHE